MAAKRQYSAPAVVAVARRHPTRASIIVGDNGSVWKEAAGYRGLIRLSATKNRLRNYFFVTVSWSPKRERVHVARLVLEAFVGPCPPGMEACHTGTPDISDNRLCNLRWDTRKANVADRVRHGAGQFGYRNPLATLSQEQGREIKRRLRESPQEKGLAARLAREFGVHPEVIYRMKRGESWRNV